MGGTWFLPSSLSLCTQFGVEVAGNGAVTPGTGCAGACVCVGMEAVASFPGFLPWTTERGPLRLPQSSGLRAALEALAAPNQEGFHVSK